VPGTWERAPDVGPGQYTHHQAAGGHAHHAPLEPLLPREQRDRGERDGDLQQGGGLRPAVVLVHDLLAALVPGQRLRLQLARFGLDFLLLLVVPVHLRLVGRLLVRRRQVARDLRERLLRALGLVVVPLVGRFGLLDRRVVLEEAGVRLGGSAQIREDRADRGDHGREHRDLVGEAAAADAVVALGGVLGHVLEFVVVRAVDVKGSL
jgi:hypothetical protein